MINDGHAIAARIDRVGRVVNVAVALVSGSLAVYWMVKWLRGDPDQYPNEIMGGLALASAMASMALSQLVRAGRTRWIIAGIGFALLATSMTVILAPWRLSALATLAAIVGVGSVVVIVRALLPGRGVGFAEWKATPVTLDQRRAICSGIAVFNLACALFFASRVDLNGPWQSMVVVASAMLVFVGAAGLFVWARFRLRS